MALRAQNMGYKRRARVAFLSANAGFLARCAVYFVNRDGSQWMQAIAIRCTNSDSPLELAQALPGIEKIALKTPRRELLEQQDLVVSLDRIATTTLNAYALAVPTRHYRVDALPLQNQVGAVEQRVKGMLAGMRMFARAETDLDA